MKKKKRPVFNLTPEEQKLEAEIERGEWKPVPREEFQALASDIEEYTQKRKEARVNLRLNSEDVAKIRAKALREGIPYQTLIASVIHKYATDQLIDEVTVKKVIKKLKD